MSESGHCGHQGTSLRAFLHLIFFLTLHAQFRYFPFCTVPFSTCVYGNNSVSLLFRLVKLLSRGRGALRGCDCAPDSAWLMDSSSLRAQPVPHGIGVTQQAMRPVSTISVAACGHVTASTTSYRRILYHFTCCSVLFFSRPRSEGWPHHGRTFSIYPCPLSF